MLADFFAGLVPPIAGLAPGSAAFGVVCSPDAYYTGPTPVTVLMLHMEQANGSTAPVDTSIVVKTATTTGTSTISTADSKFGAASLKIANLNTVTANGAAVTNHTDFNFAAGDFTIEMWCKLTALPTSTNTILFTYQGGVGATQFWVLPGGLFSYSVVGTQGSSGAGSIGTFPLNVWTHVAVVRAGTNTACLINGVFVAGLAIPTPATNLVNSGNNFLLGCDVSSSDRTWNGYIDEVRVTKGIARYGVNEPAPTAVFPISAPADPQFANVVLLAKGNGANSGTTFVDSSSYGHTPTLTAGPVTSTANFVFSAGSSMLVAGSGGLKFATGTEANIGTNDLTLEAWVYITDLTVAQIFFSINSPTAGGAYIALRMNAGGGMDFLDGTGATRSPTINMTANTWTHVAAVRSGSSIRLFVGGVVAYQSVTTANLTQSNTSISVGCADASSQPIKGNIAEFRFTNGFGRYDGSFTIQPYANCDATTSGVPLPPPTPAPTPVTDPNYSLVAFLSGFDVGTAGVALVAPVNTPAPAPAPTPPGYLALTPINLECTTGSPFSAQDSITIASNYSVNLALSVVRGLPPGLTLTMNWAYPGVGPTYAGSVQVAGTPTAATGGYVYVELKDLATGNFVAAANVFMRVRDPVALPTVNLNNHTFGPGLTPNPAGCNLVLNAVGLTAGSGVQSKTVANEWFIGSPATALSNAVATLYEYRLTLGTHTPFSGGVTLLGAYGVWQNMTAGVGYALQNTVAGTIAFANFLLEIRLVGGGGATASANITLKQRA